MLNRGSVISASHGQEEDGDGDDGGISSSVDGVAQNTHQRPPLTGFCGPEKLIVAMHFVLVSKILRNIAKGNVKY